MKNYGFHSTVVVLTYVLCVFSEKIRMLLEGLWACVETQQQDSENQLHFRGKASLNPFVISMSSYACLLTVVKCFLLV